MAQTEAAPKARVAWWQSVPFAFAAGGAVLMAANMGMHLAIPDSVQNVLLFGGAVGTIAREVWLDVTDHAAFLAQHGPDQMLQALEPVLAVLKAAIPSKMGTPSAAPAAAAPAPAASPVTVHVHAAPAPAAASGAQGSANAASDVPTAAPAPEPAKG